MATAPNLSLAAAPDIPANKRALKEFFVVSSDGHVNEPNDVWAARVDPRFRVSVATREGRTKRAANGLSRKASGLR